MSSYAAVILFLVLLLITMKSIDPSVCAVERVLMSAEVTVDGLSDKNMHL